MYMIQYGPWSYNSQDLVKLGHTWSHFKTLIKKVKLVHFHILLTVFEHTSLTCRQTQNWSDQFFPYLITVQISWVYLASRIIPAMQSATAALNVSTSREADWAFISWCLSVIWCHASSVFSQQLLQLQPLQPLPNGHWCCPVLGGGGVPALTCLGLWPAWDPTSSDDTMGEETMVIVSSNLE